MNRAGNLVLAAGLHNCFYEGTTCFPQSKRFKAQVAMPSTICPPKPHPVVSIITHPSSYCTSQPSSMWRELHKDVTLRREPSWRLATQFRFPENDQRIVKTCRRAGALVGREGSGSSLELGDWNTLYHDVHQPKFEHPKAHGKHRVRLR